LIFSTLIGVMKRKKTRPEPAEQICGENSQLSSAVSSQEPLTQNKDRGSDMGKERIKIDFLIHDLKVPLAVVEAGIKSLLTRQDKYGKLTEKQEKVLRRALRNTKITQTLVSDALELGRSREGVVHSISCNISELIRGAFLEIFDLTDDRLSEEIRACPDLSRLKQILLDHGVELRVEENFWDREVCLDEPKVKQIFRNLLNNALKYRRHSVEVEIIEEKGALVLSVSDDGEGIPQEYHQRIFECYFQMNGEGSCPVRGHGLGLAGVMVLVEDMGGTLTLESDQGQGAKFSVKIPLMREC